VPRSQENGDLCDEGARTGIRSSNCISLIASFLLVFKAHRLVYHSTLGSRVVKKKTLFWQGWWAQGACVFSFLLSSPIEIVCGGGGACGVNEAFT